MKRVSPDLRLFFNARSVPQPVKIQQIRNTVFPIIEAIAAKETPEDRISDRRRERSIHLAVPTLSPHRSSQYLPVSRDLASRFYSSFSVTLRIPRERQASSLFTVVRNAKIEIATSKHNQSPVPRSPRLNARTFR